MKQHKLFFEPVVWLGEGKITMTMSSEALKFYARWKNMSYEEGVVAFSQEVEIDEMLEKMENKFRFYDFEKQNTFKVDLENSVWGKVSGSGTYDERVIAWEFRDTDANVEGFEIYEKINDHRYYLRAEYMSSDHYRTIIQGELWIKSS